MEKNPLASSASALYTGFTEQGTHGILGTDVFGTGGAQVRYARKKKKSSWCTFCPCRETTAGAFPQCSQLLLQEFLLKPRSRGRRGSII